MSSLIALETCHRIDPQAKTALRVRPGERFTLSLLNAFGRSFDSEAEFEAFLSSENEEEKRALNHPSTGPVEIATECTNISLAIRIVDMKVNRGYQCVSRSTGLLKERFQERLCSIYEMVDDQTLRFKGSDLLMRGSPKLGFISTIDGEERSCGRCSENGGNIDLNYLDKGSVIYLPVNAEKARILVGDLHVCQGNGEAAGTGVEADGEITLEVGVVDKMNFPVIDHKSHLVIVGWGCEVQDALRKSVDNTIRYLKRIFPFCDWSDGEIYKFISAEGNLTMGNSTGKVKTCGTVFFKKRLTNQYGFHVI